MTEEHTRLAAELRELRARTGLSLAALSERTAYSKSSWERYLNGKSMPPRQAVRELCRVASEPDGRLVALWEIAESDWSGRAVVPVPAAAEPRPQPPEPPPPPETGRPRGHRGRLVVALALVYTVLVGGVALGFVLLPGREAPADELPAASVPYSPAARCHGDTCEGRDPIRLVCGIGADTLTTYRASTGAHVELRYSEKCGAGWVRMWGTRVGDRVEVTAGGPTRGVRVEDRADADSYVHTGMTAARPGRMVRACFKSASAGGAPECVEARVGKAATPRPDHPHIGGYEPAR
ncbi:helix-turn-helix domain-containing protein [Streptomyces sp. NPDC053499]|uniref:helix-turn-helix domain-containing protein n=1 Tax=Streptomyces sp. NPDC053499 TaxID=3365707 RepID=UPI0037CD86AA